MVEKGSTALPRRLDILLPFLSSTKPLEMEMAYYQSYFDESCIVVDMSGTKVGDYVLEISIGETLLLGGFSIE